MEYNYNKKYEWHPLYKYVMDVKRKFIQSFFLLENQPCPDNYDFNYWIERSHVWDEIYDNSLTQTNYVKVLREIFNPLHITCYKHYVLFKYKNFIELDEEYDLSSFFELHNGLYRECRSCVFDLKNDSIVLASLSKFKNYGEDEKDWSIKNIQNKYNLAQKIYITNKLDGSYQQYRYLKGQDEILGSGSMALDPVESWRLKEGYSLLTEGQKEMLKAYPDFTFIFEYISPKNPIVVKYEKNQEGLYLLAARGVQDGKEICFDVLKNIADEFGSKMTQWYSNSTLNQVLASTKDYLSSEKEGWVVDMVDGYNNHFRCKIKVEDYVLMHKLLSQNISPNAVIDAVHSDRFDDFYAKCPDAYKDIIMGYFYTIFKYKNLYQELVDFCLQKGKEQCDNFAENKKEAMLWFENNIPKFLRGRVRCKYLGQENDFLLKKTECYRYAEITKTLQQLEWFKQKNKL